MNFELDLEAAKTETTSVGKYLDSGVYDVTIVTLSQVTAKTGTSGFDLSFKVEGAKYPNTIYGIWTNKADGTKIFNADIISGLVGLTGAKTVTAYDKEIEVRGGNKTVKAIKEVDNFKCKVAVQKVLDVYNGDVSEKNEVKMFFTTEGKTYAESVGDKDAKQINYFSKLQDKETTNYKKMMAEGPSETVAEDDSDSLL